MKQIRTDRILIIPCSVSLAKSLILYPNDFRLVSPVKVPDCFPSDRIKGMLPLLIELFEVEGDAGWWICFIIDLKHQQFIGELELAGRSMGGEDLSFSLNFIDNQTEKEFVSEVMEGLFYYIQKMGSIQVIQTEIVDKRYSYRKALEKYGFKVERAEGNYCLMRKFIR
jgi:ribosomal-protein-alanine N-acetyltransferase